MRFITVAFCIAVAAGSATTAAPVTTQAPGVLDRFLGGACAVYGGVCGAAARLRERYDALTPDQRERIARGFLRILQTEEGREAVAAGEAAHATAVLGFGTDLPNTDRAAIEAAAGRVVAAADNRGEVVGRELLRGAARAAAGRYLTDAELERAAAIDMGVLVGRG